LEAKADTHLVEVKYQAVYADEVVFGWVSYDRGDGAAVECLCYSGVYYIVLSRDNVLRSG